MWDNMAEELWSIDNEQRNSTNYSLTTKERLFCVTGVSQGSYSKPQLKEGITQNRIERLPERIQDLIDDILLLEYSDTEFKSREEWQSLCQDIVDVEARAEKVIGKNILYSNKEQFYDEVQFGFEIGFILRLLHINNNKELIWGIMLGQFGLDKQSHDFERSVILNTLDYIQELEKNRVRAAEDLTIQDELRQDSTNTNRQKLEDVLQNYHIDPPLNKSKFERHVFSELRSLGYEFEKSDIDSFINGFIEATNISQIDRLYHTLNNDQKEISEYKQQGVKATNLIKHIYENELKNEQRIEINNFTRNQLPYPRKRNQAVAALNKLSDKNNYKLRTSNPVFSENQQKQWNTTDYGCVLMYTMLEKQDAKWVYNYSIEPQKMCSEEKDLIRRGIIETSLA